MEQKVIEKELKKLEKIVTKINRNVFRQSNLDYAVQFGISSVEPKQVKYSALISSPSRDIQEIPFRFNSINELELALNTALKTFKYEDIEKTEVQSRINVYKRKITQLEEYLDKINKHGLDKDGFLSIVAFEEDATEDEKIN